MIASSPFSQVAALRWNRISEDIDLAFSSGLSLPRAAINRLLVSIHR